MNRITFKLTKTLFLGLLLSMVWAGSVLAQANGTVRGTISDQATKGFLPGAAVVLEGTQYNAITGNDGQYRMDGVEPGTYTLHVTYIRYDE